MKVKEFLENLNALVQENPEVLEFEAVTSADSEGNSFDTVYFTPTLGRYEDREFTQYNDEDIELELAECNALCVN